jgi:hypothetical protein
MGFGPRAHAQLPLWTFFEKKLGQMVNKVGMPFSLGLQIIQA